MVHDHHRLVSGADLKQIFVLFLERFFYINNGSSEGQQRTQSVLIHFPGEKIIGLLALL